MQLQRIDIWESVGPFVHSSTQGDETCAFILSQKKQWETHHHSVWEPSTTIDVAHL